MAYTTPPTFTAGATLTAAQLNILSDDLEFLYGLTQGVNVPFSALVSTSNLSSSNNLWYIRHQHRYLHYYCVLSTGDIDEFRVYYNGTRIVQDDTNRSSTYSYTGYVDLDSSPGGLTVGTFYPLYVEATKSGAFTFEVIYLIESDLTSI